MWSLGASIPIWEFVGLSLVVTMVCAVLSWQLIERP